MAEFKCQHPDCVNRRPYTSIEGLKSHERSHKLTLEEQRPFVCSICPERFIQAVHRDSHEVTHMSAKPYPCIFENCTESFARKSDLTQHENLKHRGISGFKCDVCGRCFARQTNLSRHKQTHTSEKPYPCLCGKAFVRSDALNAHKRICTKSNAAQALLALTNGVEPIIPAQNTPQNANLNVNDENNNHDNAKKDDK